MPTATIPPEIPPIDDIRARLAALERDIADVRRQWVIDRELQTRLDMEALTKARLMALGEMSENVVHELRQPLAVVSMAAQNLLLRGAEAEPSFMQARLDRIIAAVDRASKMIDELRRFALHRGDAAEMQPVVLATAVGNVMFMLEPMLRHNGIGLNIDLPFGPDLQVMAYPVALEQVLTNLFLNARDAINDTGKAGLRQITVSAQCSQQAGKVDVLVSDSGTGIPPHVLGKLFEPFLTTKGPDRGTGLGLPLCRRLIHAMDGTIMGSNTATGAVFTITLHAVPLPGDARQPCL